MSLDEYLDLDDYALTEFMKACSSSNDGTLASLGSGLVDRKLYKATDASGVTTGKVADFKSQADQKLRELTGNPRASLLCETPGDLPYAMYDPDREERATQIYVEARDGRIEELSRHSDPVRSLTREYQFLRYYYPAEHRDEIERVADATLRRG